MPPDTSLEKSWEKISEWLRDERDPKKITELVGRLLVAFDTDEREQSPPDLKKAA
jgi:hypothetical protein